jgi:hypothetical protein
MPLPFRKNPKITTNWINSKTGKQVEKKTKKAYYEMSLVKVPGSLCMSFREEKKRLGGSAEKARDWFGHLDFELDSTFARDLKMLLNESVDKDPQEALNTVRLYIENKKWVAKLGDGHQGTGETIREALTDLTYNL